MQIQNLNVAQSTRLQNEPSRQRRERIAVGEVQVKSVTAHQYVLGIWCFKDRDATWLQNPDCLVENPDQGFEWKVFNNVEARHCAEAAGRLVF